MTVRFTSSFLFSAKMCGAQTSAVLQDGDHLLCPVWGGLVAELVLLLRHQVPAHRLPHGLCAPPRHELHRCILILT